MKNLLIYIVTADKYEQDMMDILNIVCSTIHVTQLSKLEYDFRIDTDDFKKISDWCGVTEDELFQFIIQDKNMHYLTKRLIGDD